MTLDEFTEYVSRHLDGWRAHAKQHLADHEAAEDVVQETWCRLFRHHEAIDPTQNPDAYAFRTLQSAIHDHGRALGRERRGGRVAYSDEMAACLPEPASLDSSGDSATLAHCEAFVREALSHLTVPERRALRLFLSGVGRAEALTQMSAYDGALNRARAKMADRLGARRTLVLRLGLERLLALLADSHETPSNPS